MNTQLVKHGAFRYCVFHDFNSSLCKCFHLNSRREAQQTRNFVCRSKLRIDRQAEPQIILYKANAIGIYRISHTRNRVLRTEFFRKKAAQEIYLIRARHCDEKVTVFNLCFPENCNRLAMPFNAHDIKCVSDLFKLSCIRINYYNTVIFGSKLLYECFSYLAASYNNNVQLFIPLNKILAQHNCTTSLSINQSILQLFLTF